MRTVAVLSILILGVVAWGATQVPLVQPDALPPESRGAVLAAIGTLEKLLDDWRLGCGAAALQLGWNDYQLARFVAGRLTGKGYPSLLAHRGDEWWVLTKVSAGEAELWVPVVPGIAGREDAQCYQRGVFLGHVAWAGPGTFTEAYLSPEEIVPLPVNRPPSVVIRYNPARPQPGEDVRFYGSFSVDPDGVIISFRWDFGDGETSTAMNPAHAFRQEGDYTVTLTVLDDAGNEVTATAIVKVAELSPDDKEPPEGGGCGCGG